jgi:hypothetical protein
MALDAGATLGRYRIERRIGAGAMGEVYLALDPHIDRQLALKTVLIGDASEAEIEERKVRMIREARAAGRLVHPHVVTLFDAGEAGGIFYLAFEFVAGPDLAGRQRLAPPLTLGEVLRIGRQAAEGLDAAHRQGIVHRDIKPSNILLDRQGQVKVSDFGIAKMLGQGTELTQTGSVVGSPHYLSPEQIRGEELDGRSDVFSLGVVLYELLTRHRPFEGETITTLVYQILAREPNPIAGLRPGLSERVERTVVKMLAKDRDARFATAREVADELAACERELPAAVLASPAAALPEELEETRQLAPPTPPPTPKPTPPAAWSMPMPGTPADATAPTRLSSRVGAGSGSGGSGGGGGAALGAGTPTPPVPPMAQAPAEATGPTRLSPLVGGGLGAAPPPPRPPPLGAASAAAGGHAAAPRAAATAPARGFPWAIVVVVLALGLLTVVGGVGALIWLRGGWGKKTDQAPTQVADQAANTVPAAHPNAGGPTATEPPALPAAPVPTSTTAQQPSPYGPTAPSVAPAPTRAPEPAATIKPAPTRRAEPTTRPTTRPSAPPDQDTPRHTEPVHPAPAPPSAPAPAPPVQEPEDQAPAQPYDREMASTLALKFKIEPEDAIVSFKGEGDRRFTVIGRANDFSADKRKGPAYDLPGEGTYYIRILAEGRQIIYKLDAHPGAQPTTIAHVLIPKAGRRRS